MFCTNCGATITEIQAFCTSCGTPVPTETQAPIGIPAQMRESALANENVSRRSTARSDDEYSPESREADSRGRVTPLIMLAGVALTLVGVVTGILLTASGATTFAIGPRFTEEELDAATQVSRQSGFENGKTTGYNSGFSDGKTEGYGLGFDEGKVRGYEDGYDAGQGGGYRTGYDDGRSAGYATGFDDGKTEGYDNGYSIGKTDGFEDGYDSGYAYGCRAIYRLMGRTSFTYSGRTYYDTSFCSQ